MLADLPDDDQPQRAISRFGQAATLWEMPEKIAGTVVNGHDSNA